MKHRAASIAKVTGPIRALLNRFALLFLIIAAFAIMLLGKADTLIVERARSSVVDGVAPFMDALSRPIATVSEGVDRMSRFFAVYEENAQLLEQNARLLEWQSAALALAAENSTFRNMLKFVPERGVSFASARVIGDSGGVFVRSVLINGGKVDGIHKGDAVVNGDGLIGRVAEVGLRSGRVLLLSDLNSRIPVVEEKSRIRAILAGDNSQSPKLIFLLPGARLEVGDRIVTSGHGGVFPSGLPVGRISSIGERGIRVQPFTDFYRLEHVRIITEFPGQVAGQIVPSAARPPLQK
ncbi:MAG: rod shape-determining protein MreC [Rhodospirillaceae bacterium]|nr:rod shape-determining protein MreC [Rhodospirillaceae bacterium]